ncbi:lytic transglycosylase domain-containing protein [Roseicyclus amphidinii]|uniref:lytic transglycosylase domain-containing protein n=1 Tax=Roseicyclus amphidinii TaxID=3034232 RepID=UPI0024E15A4A|nr:lytic transglycosylase domain-containing protein [Roseicyclus sp. Amp-Y-6]
MRQILLAVSLVLAPMGARADTAAMGLALDALSQGDMGLYAEAAGRIEDPVALDILSWTRLRAGRGDWPEYVAFLDRNPDWPGLPYLRAQGEPSIPAGGDPAAIIAYFDGHPPTTGAGALALALAHDAAGDRAAAEAEAIRAWTTLVMTGDEAGQLRAAFGAVLNTGTHHEERLDNLLWEGAEERARAMVPLVPEGWQALAEARLALRARAPGVDALIEAVPADLAGDPGLAYERFLWRVRSGFWDTAGELMAERSASRGSLGRPLFWADRRADLARDVMREGDFETCYTYAANHHIDPAREDYAYSENEWLAGYCAYRLGRYDTAVGHFQAFRDSVFTPISLGRAGYWLGRAEEAAGNPAAAAEAYALGARYQSSFYGQLAQERGGLPVDPAFLGTEVYGDWRQAGFTGSTVFHAALLYYEAGQDWPAERFLTHLAESLTRDEAGMLGDFALELGDPHIALRIAKRAAQFGHEIMRPYYPVVPALAEADLPAPAAMVLAIARRESEFDPGVVSPAGALGLMQVMPGTGRDTARALGLDYSQARMLDDPAYNARLGASFLAGLYDRYDDNPVLIAAAYNAGPARAADWIERFGDPRRAEDVIFWIEAIPFSETRNYIMRVTESLAIYEAQLTGTLPTLGLSERLAR